MLPPRWLTVVLGALMACCIGICPAPLAADDEKPGDGKKKVEEKDDFDDLDSASEDLTGKKRDPNKKDDELSELEKASKKIKGETADGEKIDPLVILGEVQDKMLEAEEALAKASNWKADKTQKEAIELLENLLRDDCPECKGTIKNQNGGS